MTRLDQLPIEQFPLPSMTSPSIEISQFSHLDTLPPDVSHLFDMAGRQHMEYGGPWFRNLIDSVFNTGDQVRILVSRRFGQPMAALPILVKRTFFGSRVESLSNYYTSAYSPAMAASSGAEDLIPMIKTISSIVPRPGILKFAPMDPQAPAYQGLLDACRACGLKSDEYFCFGNWYLAVPGDWKTYWKSRRANLRSTVKRAQAKFTADKGRFELIQEPKELTRGLYAYEKVYQSSWKQAEPYPNFVPGLARACASNGWLRLAIAWLDETPIAVQLWIVVGDKANIYKVAYDEKFKAYAPGSLLTAMLMEHVIDRDHVREVDFLIGDDSYKRNWMSDRRERWGIISFDPRTLSGLQGLIVQKVGRFSKGVRSKLHQWKSKQ